MSIWQDVKGYEGLYLVSDEGEIFALPKTVISGNKKVHRKGKFIKQGLRGRDGLKYKFVRLSNNGDCKTFSVHRLVAEAFLENPNNFEEVNHKDENSLNNCVNNLEWCNRQYNIEYSKNKRICQYTVDGEKIAEYKSIKYASQITGIGRTSINNALCGWCKTAGGFVWEYSE
jgi:hypothetical protein